jgi:OHCU decarboxylase
MTLDDLNRMDPQSAADLLKPCGGSQRWAEQMAGCRPFSNSSELHRAADWVWGALGRGDWLEAFASHPKIGETKEASEWSKREQKSVAGASGDTRARLARLNEQYQGRFGFIFIICATGRSTEEMLRAIEGRLQNHPDHEILEAGEEQRKIIHVRLDKLIDP